MTTITRVNPRSAARVSAFVTTAVGVLQIIGVLVTSSASGILQSDPQSVIVTVLIMLIGFPIAGAISGLIMAVVYNFVAARFGGLEVELSNS